MGCLINIIGTVLYYASFLLGQLWIPPVIGCIWILVSLLAPSVLHTGYEASDEFESGIINAGIAFLIIVIPFAV